MTITLETTVDGVIQVHAGEPDDSEFLRLVITTILAEEDPAKLLTPMVRGYLLGRKRAIVRAAEHAAFRDYDTTTKLRVTGAAAVAELSPLMAARLSPILGEIIHIPGYGPVTWGAATVTQLQARASMYEQQRQALDDAITDVHTAIEAIEATPGASCLNDVYRTRM